METWKDDLYNSLGKAVGKTTARTRGQGANASPNGTSD